MSAALDLIDMGARRYERAHEQTQSELKLALAEHMDMPSAHTHAALGHLALALREIRVRASHEIAPAAGGELRQLVNEVLLQAEEDTGLELSDDTRKTLFGLVDRSVETAMNQLRDALRLDEDTALQTMRRAQLRGAMKAATGVDPHIAFRMSKSGSIAGLAFTRRDRAGRAWQTTVYSRTVVRALLVNTYVESFAMTLLANGIDRAKVNAADEGGAPHWLQFSLVNADNAYVGDDFLVTLDEAQQAYFHPNATRLPERV
jgi:hypothetical protein